MTKLEGSRMAERLIQVCGDPTVDWLSIRREEATATSGGIYFFLPNEQVPKVQLSSQAGGSALILQLLREMVPPDLSRVEGRALEERLLKEPKDSPITTSWTVWKAHPGREKGRVAFRLIEWRECETGQWDYAANRLSGSPDLLVIEDAGLGLRNCREGWPEALTEDAVRPQHLLLKLSQYGDPRQENPLFNRILQLGLAERTTVVTSIADLRSCPVKVGVSLSWERMMEEVASAILSPECPFVDRRTGRLAFRRVIVTIGAGGAVLVDRESKSLVFDRTGQEDDFARRHEGQLMGYNTCMVGALAAAWAEYGEAVNWAEATRTGIGLARLLHLIGYEPTNDGPRKHLRFPARAIAEGYRQRYQGNRMVGDPRDPDRVWDLGLFVDDRGLVERAVPWSILQETVAAPQIQRSLTPTSGGVDAVCECARAIVRKGPEAAMPDAPVEAVGKWRSADRMEIEGVRSVNNAFRDYLGVNNPSTPLCVAVFGPPGAGKSFAVKEIAAGLNIGKDAQLTFNLSQFESPRELAIAFHQIRDLHLKGKMPLVFWDEFDTPCEGRPLGWLRYFLAPMQDGEFTEQGRVHPVGGGIYVFAGATRYSFADFCAGSSAEELAAKKPDFISRLRAYIDVRGPNGNPNTLQDRLFLIRRAFLLNSYLERFAPQLKKQREFQIENGVLNALLRVGRYRHGARSMETLVRMSALQGKQKYELSSLPPHHVLQMHVNADEFASLTRMGHREMLRVGITGHIHLDPNRMEELEEGVRRAVAFIEECFPERYLTVFSPMARGADRLVARALLRTEGAKLIAVLPVPQKDYMDDFGRTDRHHLDYAGAELRQEFRYWLSERAIEVIEMPPMATRDEAYQKAGYFIVEHSDVMVAVWDGLGAQGQGGTAEIVARALEMGKPVCHVWAGNHKENERKRTEVGENHGRFRHVNFPRFPRDEWAGECPNSPPQKPAPVSGLRPLTVQEVESVAEKRGRGETASAMEEAGQEGV